MTLIRARDNITVIGITLHLFSRPSGPRSDRSRSSTAKYVPPAIIPRSVKVSGLRSPGRAAPREGRGVGPRSHLWPCVAGAGGRQRRVVDPGAPGGGGCEHSTVTGHCTVSASLRTIGTSARWRRAGRTAGTGTAAGGARAPRGPRPAALTAPRAPARAHPRCAGRPARPAPSRPPRSRPPRSRRAASAGDAISTNDACFRL